MSGWPVPSHLFSPDPVSTVCQSRLLKAPVRSYRSPRGNLMWLPIIVRRKPMSTQWPAASCRPPPPASSGSWHVSFVTSRTLFPHVSQHAAAVRMPAAKVNSSGSRSGLPRLKPLLRHFTCMTSGKLLDLSVPRFPICKREIIIYNYVLLIDTLRGFNCYYM